MNDIRLNNLEVLKKGSKIKDFDSEYSMFKSKINKMLSDNPDCTPILIIITGSSSYKLDLEESDLDGKGVYIQDLDSILSELKIGQANSLKYKPQIGESSENGKKAKEDIVLYELGRYLELLQDNNPNILEIFSSPDDCIVYKHPIWDELVNTLKNSDVLTKKCYHTFHSYASQQIKKASGLNKKINNPIDKERKTPIDFSYVIFDDDSTMNLRSYLEKNKLDQRMCGLTKTSHAKDLYSLYYDIQSAKSFSKHEDIKIREEHRVSKKLSGETMGFGYKGIIKENEENTEISNEIRVSSVPTSEKRMCIMSYNKDGYMTYCKRIYCVLG